LITVDPSGTLLRVAGLSLAAGLVWAALACMAIYLGSTRFKPVVSHGRVWAEWRRKWWLWGLSLILTAAGAFFTAHSICREFAFRDLYWLGRAADIITIARLGSGSGYLLMLALVVIGSLIVRRRASRTPRLPSKPGKSS
jgi:hypothetical protein